MTCSYVITLKDGRTQSDMAKYIKDTSDPRGQARVISRLFERIGAGFELSNFDVQTSANAPVRASIAITVVYASLSASDYVTVAGQALTCKTSNPGTHQYLKVTDGPTTAANLAALINADSGTKTLVSATSSGSVVTIKSLVPGAIGNFLTIASSSAGVTIAASATNFGSGAGGAETVAVSYSRGL